MTTRELELCQMLEDNIVDEAQARQGYLKIFEWYDNELTNNERRLLKEIIAEELKHSEILHEMISNRTGIIAEK